MAQTLAQKILQAHTDEAVEQDGQIVQCRVSLVLANDITGPLAIKSFYGMGAKKVLTATRLRWSWITLRRKRILIPPIRCL